MNLDIRHLKLLVAVTEEKSVTKAGERLHLSQSALSHQLRDLEERLGTPLFLRLNKRMVLTQAGERLLASAKEVLDELKRAEEEVAQMALHKRGTLRLSTECYTCYHWLPEKLKTFSQRFPDVDVKIVVEATHQPLRALLNGKLELAVVSDQPRDSRVVPVSAIPSRAATATCTSRSRSKVSSPRDDTRSHCPSSSPRRPTTTWMCG